MTTNRPANTKSARPHLVKETTMARYTGPRTITAKLADPGTYRPGLWLAYIDGKNHYGLHGDTEAEALAAAERAATRMDTDDAIYPAAKAVAATLTDHQADQLFPDAGAGPEDFHLGQTVAVWSRGQIRVGIVEKIGRKNVTVVYVTASSGNLWRKAMPFDKVYPAAGPGPVDEPERPAAVVRYVLGLEALAGPLGGQERSTLVAELRNADQAIVDAAARHYGWDPSRVGGHVDHDGRNGARIGDVFVGSNYAGRVVRSRDELLLDRDGQDVRIPLADALGEVVNETERRWFDAGRRARQEIGLPAPPAFYARLAAAIRMRRRDEAPATPEPRPTSTK